MFNKLLEHLHAKHLSFFWEPTHNMFSEMDPNALTDICSRMKGIRRELTKINLPTYSGFQKEQILCMILCNQKIDLK